MSDIKTAKCIFDVYDLKFGMARGEVSGLIAIDGEDQVLGEALDRVNAESVLLFFDHEERLWQVKAYYRIAGHEEAEALLEKMSEDYRFQTPQTRIAFELLDKDDGTSTLYIRYTELNRKRIYIHHMMALGAAKAAEAEEMEKAVKEKEEEEYIPSGPLIF